MAGHVVPAWLAYFKRNQKCLIVSASLPQAQKIVQEFVEILEENEMLNDLIPERHEQIWTKKHIRTTTGFDMRAVPCTKNIKGYHVDYVMCDEVSAYDDHEIFFRFVQTRAETRNGTVCCISTPDNIVDLMQVLKTRPGYNVKTYPAESPIGTAISVRFPIEKLRRIRAQIGEAAYEREYLCNPRAVKEGSVFPPNIVQRAFAYGDRFVTASNGEGVVIIGADFAISKGHKADFDAYVVIQRVGGKIVLLHGETSKGTATPTKVRRLGQLADMYDPLFIACDPSMIGESVMTDLKDLGYPARAADFHAKNRGRMLMKLRRAFDKDDIILPYHPEDVAAQNFVNTLAAELIQIIEQRTPGTQQLTFVSKGAHDDTVMALAAAVSSVIKQKGFFEFGGV